MSSKEQFKDALKRDKEIISELNKKILLKDKIIKELNDQNSILGIRISLKQKKWWQFWK
jgi:hypothetical protein